MCLFRVNRNCGPKYATKDITCYKVLCKNHKNNTYYSPYQFFTYELNKCVSSNFSFALPFIGIPTPQIEYNSLKLFRNFDCVRQGLHSCKYLSGAIGYSFRFVEGYVMECTIPKGSWYYEGTDHELVSDNIIINREM